MRQLWLSEFLKSHIEFEENITDPFQTITNCVGFSFGNSFINVKDARGLHDRPRRLHSGDNVSALLEKREELLLLGHWSLGSSGFERLENCTFCYIFEQFSLIPPHFIYSSEQESPQYVLWGHVRPKNCRCFGAENKILKFLCLIFFPLSPHPFFFNCYLIDNILSWAEIKRHLRNNKIRKYFYWKIEKMIKLFSLSLF